MQSNMLSIQMKAIAFIISISFICVATTEAQVQLRPSVAQSEVAAHLKEDALLIKGGAKIGKSLSGKFSAGRIARGFFRATAKAITSSAKAVGKSVRKQTKPIQKSLQSKGKEGGTYLLRDPSTSRVVRTGRTNDLPRRQGEHARKPELKKYEFEVDRRTNKYEEQRGREQIIHDKLKPPLNKRNPISPKNPRKDEYIKEAEKL